MSEEEISKKPADAGLPKPLAGEVRPLQTATTAPNQPAAETVKAVSPETVDETPSPSNSNFMLFGVGAVAVLILAVVAMLIITGGDVAETPAPASLSIEAATGKQLFLANNCSNCHPAEGRAGGTGPRLSTVGLGDDAIRNTIRRGKGAMPNNNRLSDDQIGQVITYIRAIKPPPDGK